MTRTSKAGARNNKKVKILCFFTESNIIRNQGSWEDVEGALWFYYMVT